MLFSEAEQSCFERELALILPLLTSATPTRQEELLDEAFARAGLDPSWAEWSLIANVVLPARRSRAERRVIPTTVTE